MKESIRLLYGLAILFSHLLAGEALARAGLPLPGNVVGLLLLLISLSAGWVKLKDIEVAAGLLLDHLTLLFVPVVVGVVIYFDLIGRQFWAISAAVFGSTLAVLLVTGVVAEELIARAEGGRRSEEGECAE